MTQFIFINEDSDKQEIIKDIQYAASKEIDRLHKSGIKMMIVKITATDWRGESEHN